MDRLDALRLAIRCARDSMPPLRLAILLDVAAHAGASMREVRQRLGKPRATVDRQLQALQMLGVLVVEEEETTHAGRPATVWRYSLADGIKPDVLSVPEKSSHGEKGIGKREETPRTSTDISGTATEPVMQRGVRL